MSKYAIIVLYRMHLLWPIIEHLLEKTHPRVIVEIGTGAGKTTRLLAAWCQQRGAMLHTIDPEPQADISPLLREFPSVVFHHDTSLNVLPSLPPFDCMLIDGDHNWYTVTRELELSMGRTPAPMIVLHDIGWPYGRRDQYYQPERIPAEFRQETTKYGINPETDKLTVNGFNEGKTHACRSGGPKNGVLTAVEDTLTMHPDWRLATIPCFHGLGILAPHTMDIPLPDLTQCVSDLEAERLHTLIEQAKIRALSTSLQHSLTHAEQERDALRYATKRMQQTLSWRLTAPLRRLFPPAR